MKIIKTQYSDKSKGHYSPGVIVGNTLYISGQVPNDPETGVLPEGINEQVKAGLNNVYLVLKAAGLDKTNVAMCRIFSADSAFWDAINDEFSAFFGAHKPARIIIPTKDFKPGLLVEIEAIAECS